MESGVGELTNSEPSFPPSLSLSLSRALAVCLVPFSPHTPLLSPAASLLKSLRRPKKSNSFSYPRFSCLFVRPPVYILPSHPGQGTWSVGEAQPRGQVSSRAPGTLSFKGAA